MDNRLQVKYLLSLQIFVYMKVVRCGSVSKIYQHVFPIKLGVLYNRNKSSNNIVIVYISRIIISGTVFSVRNLDIVCLFVAIQADLFILKKNYKPQYL